VDERVRKLTHLLRDADTAAKLVEAGLDTPRRIKAATDDQLEAVRGVGPATRADLRKRFPAAGRGVEG